MKPATPVTSTDRAAMEGLDWRIVTRSGSSSLGS
jgi:hypothetical protein